MVQYMRAAILPGLSWISDDDEEVGGSILASTSTEIVLAPAGSCLAGAYK